MSSPNMKRDSRQSVQTFDVDIFRNKLESFQRRQASEMDEVVNTKKRKYNDRWSDIEREEKELEEDYRDDLVVQFGKRSRHNSYYPLDDDEVEAEEISPLALPSPASEPETAHFDQSWPDFRRALEQIESQAMEMRRQQSGYSEVSNTSEDESWMSSCPPLSRASLSSSNSMPNTPRAEMETDIEQCAALHAPSFDNPQECLDLSTLEPHERNLLAALAPERFERAALIKKAFRQSDKLLDAFAKEQQKLKQEEIHDTPMDVDFDVEEFLHV